MDTLILTNILRNKYKHLKFRVTEVKNEKTKYSTKI